MTQGFQVKTRLVPVKQKRERDINGSDLADACANLLFSRGNAWDEPPCSYWAYKTRKGLVLRDAGVPGEIIQQFGPPGRFLRALARWIEAGGIAPLRRPGEQVAGYVFRSEAWEVIKANPSESELERTQELTARRRLYTHPDRIETRMASAGLIGEHPWYFSLQRGKELISAMQTTASPPEDETPDAMTSVFGDRIEGDVPDGVFLVCRALEKFRDNGKERDDRQAENAARTGADEQARR